MLKALILTGVLCLAEPARGETITVAVASNFAAAARELVSEFEAESGHSITLLLGSTGKHTAQIRHGLNVDVFLAADAARPILLENRGVSVAGSRFTYAVGRLALLGGATGSVSQADLTKLDDQRIAIANPKFAPYGMAAIELLKTLGVYQQLRDNIVQGENVAQAYQFVRTGHAPYGLVAYSQVKNQPNPYWLVPQELHQPIQQQAVLIQDNKASRGFLNFLRSAKALELIQHHGYDTP